MDDPSGSGASTSASPRSPVNDDNIATGTEVPYSMHLEPTAPPDEVYEEIGRADALTSLERLAAPLHGLLSEIRDALSAVLDKLDDGDPVQTTRPVTASAKLHQRGIAKLVSTIAKRGPGRKTRFVGPEARSGTSDDMRRRRVDELLGLVDEFTGLITRIAEVYAAEVPIDGLQRTRMPHWTLYKGQDLLRSILHEIPKLSAPLREGLITSEIQRLADWHDQLKELLEPYPDFRSLSSDLGEADQTTPICPLESLVPVHLLSGPRGRKSCSLQRFVAWTEAQSSSAIEPIGRLHSVYVYRSKKAPFYHEYVMAGFGHEGEPATSWIRLERAARAKPAPSALQADSSHPIFAGVAVRERVTFSASQYMLCLNSDEMASIILPRSATAIPLPFFVVQVDETSKSHSNYQLLSANCRWFARRTFLNVVQLCASHAGSPCSITWKGRHSTLPDVATRLRAERFGGATLVDAQSKLLEFLLRSPRVPRVGSATHSPSGILLEPGHTENFGPLLESDIGAHDRLNLEARIFVNMALESVLQGSENAIRYAQAASTLYRSTRVSLSLFADIPHRSLLFLGIGLDNIGRTTEALHAFRDAVRLSTDSAIQSAVMYQIQVGLTLSKGSPAEAKKALGELETASKMAHSVPRDVEDRGFLQAWAHANILQASAIAWDKLESFSESLSAWREVSTMRRDEQLANSVPDRRLRFLWSIGGGDALGLVSALGGQAKAAYRSGKLEECYACMQEALQWIRRRVVTLNSHRSESWCHHLEQHYSLAVELNHDTMQRDILEELIAVVRSPNAKPVDWDLLPLRFVHHNARLAFLHSNTNNPLRAVEILDILLPLVRDNWARLTENEEDFAYAVSLRLVVLQQYGDLCSQLGRPSAAVKAYGEAVGLSMAPPIVNAVKQTSWWPKALRAVRGGLARARIALARREGLDAVRTTGVYFHFVADDADGGDASPVSSSLALCATSVLDELDVKSAALRICASLFHLKGNSGHAAEIQTLSLRLQQHAQNSFAGKEWGRRALSLAEGWLCLAKYQQSMGDYASAKISLAASFHRLFDQGEPEHSDPWLRGDSTPWEPNSEGDHLRYRFLLAVRQQRDELYVLGRVSEATEASMMETDVYRCWHLQALLPFEESTKLGEHPDGVLALASDFFNTAKRLAASNSFTREARRNPLSWARSSLLLSRLAFELKGGDFDKAEFSPEAEPTRDTEDEWFTLEQVLFRHAAFAVDLEEDESAIEALQEVSMLQSKKVQDAKIADEPSVGITVKSKDALQKTDTLTITAASDGNVLEKALPNWTSTIWYLTLLGEPSKDAARGKGTREERASALERSRIDWIHRREDHPPDQSVHTEAGLALASEYASLAYELYVTEGRREDAAVALTTEMSILMSVLAEHEEVTPSDISRIATGYDVRREYIRRGDNEGAIRSAWQSFILSRVASKIGATSLGEGVETKEMEKDEMSWGVVLCRIADLITG